MDIPKSFGIVSLRRLRKEIGQTIGICELKASIPSVKIVKHAMMYHGALSYSRERPLETCLRGLIL